MNLEIRTEKPRIWKIKPWYNKPHYYRVLIFKTKEQMWQYAQEHNFVGTCDTNFRAITHSQRLERYIKGRWREDKEHLGVILFCYDHIGSEVVSHEMTHAALYWLHRVHGLDVVDTYKDTYDEDGNVTMHERLCQVVGEMTRVFWRKYYRYVMPIEI